MCQLAIQLQEFYLSSLGSLRAVFWDHFYFSSLLTISQINGQCLLFADDAKCFWPISSRADCLSLQSDLSLLADWSSILEALFQREQMSIIRFTRSLSNAILFYTINNTTLSSVGTQKDLGVILSSGNLTTY